MLNLQTAKCTNLKCKKFCTHVFTRAIATHSRYFQHLEGSLLPIQDPPPPGVATVMTPITRDHFCLFLNYSNDKSVVVLLCV